MALRSTFYSFTTASRALAINQKSLDVVGQNISNMGTAGYTRQRVDRYSVSAPAGSLYAGKTNPAVGQGVEVLKISQSRDPFLDIRFRKEAPKVGELDAKLTILEELEGVFDETMMDGISSQMSDLVKQLQTLSSKTGNPEFDGIVKTSAELLTRLFNQFGDNLTSLRKEQEYSLENIAVPKVNDLIKSIENLNKSIKKDQMLGNPALELLDQRNALLDELSQYVNIDVKTTTVQVAPGVSYEEVAVNLVSGGGNIAIIDPENPGGTFKAEKNPDGNYALTFVGPNGAKQDVTDQLSSGTIKGYLDMLNKAGEFDNPASTIKGIGYYQNMLDTLARTFAQEMNNLNQSVIVDGVEKIKGGDLFTQNGQAVFDANQITASNIKISSGWAANDYGIVCATQEEAQNPGDISAANGNILKMISLFSNKIEFTAQITNADGSTQNRNLFSGTFQEMLSQTGNVLALEVKSSTQTLENYLSVIENISGLRDSVSAVSLDEEGINLLQFQKSYNAAARLMTVLDEAIATIINGMGVVGR